MGLDSPIKNGRHRHVACSSKSHQWQAGANALMPTIGFSIRIWRWHRFSFCSADGVTKRR